MNSTHSLIVAKLHDMWRDAVTETNNIFSDPGFNPDDANRAMIRQKAFEEALDAIATLEVPRG